MFKHAIVGTDLSKASAKLIESSDEFGKIGIEKITLVHVLDLRNTQLLSSYKLDDIDNSIAFQKSILERKGFAVNAEVIFGIPSVEIERKRKAIGADLIIVGSNGSNWGGSVLGTTATEVLHSMKSPVLLMVLKQTTSIDDLAFQKNFYEYEKLIKQLQSFEPDWELYTQNLPENILFPTDFSDPSEHAFQCLLEQTFAIKRLTLLHVQDEVKIGSHLKNRLEEFNRIDNERLNRLAQAFIQKHPESEIVIKMIYGKPKKEIIKFIQNERITLTVLGSQGRGYLSELVLGSVSYHVARHADSHVLLIPLTC